MRRCIALLLILLITGSVQAESDSISNPGLRVYVEETGGMEMSGLLGGIAIDVGIGNLSNSTGDVPSSQWPAIAEVYTATWCGNCLDSGGTRLRNSLENAPLKHSTIIVSIRNLGSLWD